MERRGNQVDGWGAGRKTGASLRKDASAAGWSGFPLEWNGRVAGNATVPLSIPPIAGERGTRVKKARKSYFGRTFAFLSSQSC